MSAYIYKLTSKTMEIVIDGQTHTAALLSYSHKPWPSIGYGEADPDAGKWRGIETLERNWEKRGGTPRYAVIADSKAKAKLNGAEVIDWHSGNASNATCSTQDIDWNGRKLIGHLKANNNTVTTMAKHIIQANLSSFVHSFNEEHILVVTTAIRAEAKQFENEQAAIDWREEHTDAGYGLTSADSSVEKL